MVRSILDVWSAGCVLAELLLGQPIFPGDSGVDQLVEIIKVLGTPTRDQIKEMNPNYTEFKFPQIKSHPWQKVSHSIPHILSFLRLLFFHLYFIIITFLPEKKERKKNEIELNSKIFQTGFCFLNKFIGFFFEIIKKFQKNSNKNKYVQSI